MNFVTIKPIQSSSKLDEFEVGKNVSVKNLLSMLQNERDQRIKLEKQLISVRIRLMFLKFFESKFTKIFFN